MPIIFHIFVLKPFLHIITRFQLVDIEMFSAIWLGEENQCSVALRVFHYKTCRGI